MKKTLLVIFFAACSIAAKAQKTDSTTLHPVNAEFHSIEQMPEFPGGPERFGMFLSRNLNYPEDSWKKKIQGKVLVQMLVKGDGSIDSIKVLRGPAEDLNKEAMRVIALSPKWRPGRQNGQPATIKFIVPINFTLPPENDKEKSKN
jgi:TonB family protein